jgi:hypothetical protein
MLILWSSKILLGLFMSEDKNLRALLLCATKDPAFRMRFLSNPEAVAKENKVTLKADQLEKIKKTAAFIDSLNDIRLPPGPIYYPIDPVLNSWTLGEIKNVLKYSYIPRLRWIFYAPDINQVVGGGIRER